MRVRVAGDSEDNDFTTDFDINETFVGRGGDDSFLISWYEERDRFIGGPGKDTLKMDYFRLGEYGQIADLNRAIWFDGGIGIDRIEYKVIYTPESHKTEHHGKGRYVYIGPHGQNVLQMQMQMSFGLFDLS